MDTTPLKRTQMHQNIIDAFGTIAHAARVMKVVHKQTIYNWIHKNEIPEHRKRKIRDLGYDPETFKPLSQRSNHL